VDGPRVAKGALVFGAGLVILTASIVAVFLSMRDVMAIGGSCASGGPYEVATPCPEGTTVLMVGGIFGWFLGAGLTAVAGGRLPGSYGALALLAWPGLFLSLGWNFLEFGLDPPQGGGAESGLVFCGVLFFAMGGIPLLFAVKGLGRTLWPPQADAEPSGLFSLSGQFRTATSRARPTVRNARPTPKDAGPPQDDEPSDEPEDPAVPGAGRPGDVVRGLERLADLHSRGAIDDDEFVRAKDVLLDTEEDWR
jgi:hypothetical protein